VLVKGEIANSQIGEWSTPRSILDSVVGTWWNWERERESAILLSSMPA